MICKDIKRGPDSIVVESSPRICLVFKKLIFKSSD